MSQGFGPYAWLSNTHFSFKLLTCRQPPPSVFFRTETFVRIFLIPITRYIYLCVCTVSYCGTCWTALLEKEPLIGLKGRELKRESLTVWKHYLSIKS